MRRVAALALALLCCSEAGAQQRVVSSAPEAVSVTAYRDPGRSAEAGFNLGWLGGYALVTETRTVQLPAGDSELRFEGVAGSINPASVIIRGLPAMPAEKNYDAMLLSAGSLIDASLGRQVHLRRTNRATGKVTEVEAIVRSGPSGIVIQTAAGYEALRCTGLPETIVYADVPDGLSAKPTLSVRASSPNPVTATVRLSYLAGQFDWQANYVARLSEDGKSLDLFAWLTLANGNDESFVQAHVQAVAGKPTRADDEEDGGTYSPGISLRCWPQGTTSDPVSPYPPPPPPPPPPSTEAESDGEDIVVTGSRREDKLMAATPVVAMSAQQEELGDLKLYRVPEPVTVAANGQKQIALLHKEKAQVERLHSLVVNAESESDEPVAAMLLLRMKNSKERGLGLPLPAGSVALFEQVGDRSMLAGEIRLEDLAVDEDVELQVGESPDVRLTQRALSATESKDGERMRKVRYQLEVTNARPTATTVEVGLRLYGDLDIERTSAKLRLVKGRRTWIAKLPANGRARFEYTVVRPKPPKRTGD